MDAEPHEPCADSGPNKISSAEEQIKPLEPCAESSSDRAADQAPSSAEDVIADAPPTLAEDSAKIAAPPLESSLSEEPKARKSCGPSGDEWRKRDTFGIYREAAEAFNAQLAEIPILQSLSAQSRLPPLAIAVIGASGVLAFCLWGFCGHLINCLLGMLIPAFESFKCVEAFSNIADPTEVYAKASSMQFWLIYWIVVAMFASCEYMFYYIVTWIPFYYPVKLTALMWLWLPQTRGANTVYHWLLAPTFRKHRRQIDETIDKGSKHLKKSVSGAVSNMAVAGLGVGAGGVTQLSRTVSYAVPELGGMVLNKLRSFSMSSSQESPEEKLKAAKAA